MLLDNAMNQESHMGVKETKSRENKKKERTKEVFQRWRVPTNKNKKKIINECPG